MTGPQKLSPTHRQIADWLLQNPGSKRLRECAEHFGVTRSWLSCIIHSDAFQAHLHELQAEADTMVVADIPAKLRGVAALALDGLGESLEAVLDDPSSKMLHRNFLAETVDMTLTRLGYGVKTPAPPGQGGATYTQNNLFLGPVDPKVLAGARERLLNATPMEVLPATVPETHELQPGEGGNSRPVQR
jgi:hypothetical protein